MDVFYFIFLFFYFSYFLIGIIILIILSLDRKLNSWAGTFVDDHDLRECIWYAIREGHKRFFYSTSFFVSVNFYEMITWIRYTKIILVSHSIFFSLKIKWNEIIMTIDAFISGNWRLLSFAFNGKSLFSHFLFYFPPSTWFLQ